MRNLVLLLVMMLLTACGSSGGGDSAEQKVNNETTGSQGTLLVKFNTNQAKVVPLTSYATSFQNYSTFVRVVVTNPGIKVNNLPFKEIRQTYIPGGSVSLPVPTGSGFVVEAVTFWKDTVKGTTLNRMLQYAKSAPVTIGSAGTTINLSLHDINVVMNGYSSSITTNSTYRVLANMSTAQGRTATPLQSAWSLSVNTGSDFTAPTHLMANPSTTHNLVAPNAFADSKLYFQGEFFINRSLLLDTEMSTLWTYNYPNPLYTAMNGPGSLSALLYVPVGNVTIQF